MHTNRSNGSATSSRAPSSRKGGSKKASGESKRIYLALSQKKLPSPPKVLAEAEEPESTDEFEEEEVSKEAMPSLPEEPMANPPAAAPESIPVPPPPPVPDAVESGAAAEAPNEVSPVAPSVDPKSDPLEGFETLPIPVQDVLQIACFLAFAAGQPMMEIADLHGAATALNNVKGIESIWRDAPAGEARALAVGKAFERIGKNWRDTVTQVLHIAKKDELPCFSVVQQDPLRIKAANEHAEATFVARVLCKGLCTLPPEAASPWRWAKQWKSVLSAGAFIGRDFSNGLLKACIAQGKNALSLRAVIGGHRPTAISAVNQILRGDVISLDLRDNVLTSSELTMLGPALATSRMLSKLILSGNPVNTTSVASLCEGVIQSEDSPLIELDLSRTAIGGGHTEDAASQIGELAKLVTLGGALRILNIASTSTGDAAGASFISCLGEPSPPLEGDKTLQLMTLDLSHNELGANFAGALPKALPSLKSLTTCNVAYNNFGSDAGSKVIVALLAHPSMTSVDLSGTNLCDVSPLHKSAKPTSWSSVAIGELAKALPTSSVVEVTLHTVELCGLWMERVGGEPAMRGTYTTAGIDLLVEALKNSEGPASLRRGGLKFSQDNFVGSLAEERLAAALQANSEKPPVVKPVEPEPEPEPPPPEPVKKPPPRVPREPREPRETPSSPAVEKKAVPASQPETTPKKDADTPAEASKDEAKPAEDTSKAAAKTDAAPTPATTVPTPAPELPAASQATADKGGATDRPTDRGEKGPSKPPAGKGKPAGAKSKAAAAKAAKAEAEKAAAEKAEEEKQEKEKGKSSGYGGYGQSKKTKKKVEKVVVEEVSSPFAQSPLMVALSTLAVRTGAAHDSPAIENGYKILPGSLVRVGASEMLSFKEKLMTKPVNETRMHIELDGDQEPLGWVTGVTRDEVETLKLAARGFPLMKAVKTLPLRETQEPDAAKVGEIAKDTNVRIMEKVVTEDGVEKALVSREGIVATPVGWINLILAGKEKNDADASSVVPTPMLEITFDLKVHTAQSLIRVLANKGSATGLDLTKRKKEGNDLPVQVAGKRPKFGDQDGPTTSRHAIVETPATLVMTFNCFNAAFAVTSWTGKEHPFEKLPLEQSFDLLLKKNRKKRIGRLKLAYTLNTPFLERVEFPNEWLPCEEYGLTNDGWQSSATLELEIVWGKEVASIVVYPWLAYSASIGARIVLRKVGAPSGQCATVQRILADDRIVARVDGYSKADGVKGEVILDLQPANVVRTSFPHYPRDTKLLILHDKKLLDASIIHWVGGTQEDEGSRHMISVKPPDAKIGRQVWHDLNQFNHVAVPPNVTAAYFEEQRLSYCQWVMQHEDKVEDAITGNLLLIKDQLIFLAMADVPGGICPQIYSEMHNVPDLVKEQTRPSPKRMEGAHIAQPVLVRAGPGTGKTWMIKQALFLTAEWCGDDKTAGEGVRLVPVIVYVQRVVRLLRELGDDPHELLSDPNGLMRWYISSEFVEQHKEREMLLLAHDLCALVVLVDGVDEAAGMREIVEAFVHYELVPSGNRLMVTSRPEGVDINDYKGRFVVINLKELSQEQQRTVIQMQLQGNKFFEHLVNIAECRKEMDKLYKAAFRSEALRMEIEDTKFGENELQAADTKVSDTARAILEAVKAREEEREADEGKALSAEDKAADAELNAKKRWSDFREAAIAKRHALKANRAQRKMMVDSQAELQTYLEQADVDMARELKSSYLQQINVGMMTATKMFGKPLDLVETDIKTLPTPCTRAHIWPIVFGCQKFMQQKVKFDDDATECLMQIALQRKMPLSGGRRGARAVAITAPGLWNEVLKTVDEQYVSFDAVTPQIMHLMGIACGKASLETYALRQDNNGRYLPGTAKNKPTLKYRNPVALWVACTQSGSTGENSEPPGWIATLTLECETGEQCHALVTQLLQPVELEQPGELLCLTPMHLTNSFSSRDSHPTRQRGCELQMLYTSSKCEVSMPVLVKIQQKATVSAYMETREYSIAYNYFWDRMIGMTHEAFDKRFEILLAFLVEAIGVPVLLSLLLLAYSAIKSKSDGKDNDAVINLDELPETRLQLYKLGINAGIRNRMRIESNSRQGKEKQEREAKEAEKAAAAQTEEGNTGGSKRVKRKMTLEEGMGSSYGGGSASGGSGAKGDDDSKMSKKQVHHSEGPVMDLNSILRGKKVRVLSGEDDVSECYALCVRVLSKSKQAGFDMRTGIVAVVPKSHTMHTIVTALVEYVLIPPPQSETQLNEVCKKMVRRVAVSNQENGRREFTSKDVACVLGLYPDELGLWSRLELNDDYGVALAATLAKQTDKAPAQYQFKHLSFQEGLYAEYLLLTVTSLAPPQGPGWQGWVSDKAASEFLNNRYMNNTCRIASGYLGGLLARQRKQWDFRNAPLTENGRSALWFITDTNPEVESINVAQNDVGWDDVPGMCKMLKTCKELKVIDLSQNDLFQLVESHSSTWAKLCEAFANNRTLTDLNLNNNKLGMNGIRMVTTALQSLKTLKRLGLSYNEPSVEPALADLLRKHPTLQSIELVEALDRHLPTRAKDEIGRAMLENKACQLAFLHCDMFVLSEEVKTLTWPKEASTSDAVLIGGALRANSVLTAFNLAPGATLDSKARSEIGYALLNNPNSSVAYCNDFGLAPNVESVEFDLSRSELKDVEPFRLLAGCLKGNRTVRKVKLNNLRIELIETLAQALRCNVNLEELEIVSASRGGGTSIVKLPVPELNGSKEVDGVKMTRVDLSQTCENGALNRVTCGVIGALVGNNTSLQCLDLTGTGVGAAVGMEGEGGHILFRPLCQDNICPISEVILDNSGLNDKGGGKLISALVEGLGKGDHGYEKITAMSLGHNDLGKQFATALKQLLWSERAQCMIKSLDVSHNVGLDGYELAVSLKRNDSLTSLDIRGVPGANTADIHSFIGSYLLQDDCACRLGFLSCDAFQITAGATELVYSQVDPAADAAAEQKEGGGENSFKEKKKPQLTVGGKVDPIILLLAGVIKFNSTLKNLTLASGVNNEGAKSLATAIKENKTLEHLDISGQNLIDAEGVEQIASAICKHPKLESVKIEGSASLPIAQLRGTQGAEALNVSHWNLGVLSAHGMGTLLRGNQQLTSVNLDHNLFGASGIKAIIEGLGEAPIKSLHVRSTGLAGTEESTLEALSASICSHLGQVAELRMDENDLVCEPDALAPLCKLRNVRTLSLEKNRLTRVPLLIGTMLTLRHLLLYSNQLVELPPSLCLITGLEVLDVHKNMITTLPSIIGSLKSLKKLDVSENKIIELPVSICELSEDMLLSVGRNPLEKPAIEQARQGIGVIRRFFGWSKKDAADTSEQATQATGEVMTAGGKSADRPMRGPNMASRHDWAGSGGVIMLFNCHGCTFRLVDGSDTSGLMIDTDELQITSAFNMQTIGKFRPARSPSDTFADRVEFYNMWLPWSSQTLKIGKEPSVLVQIKGKGRAIANLMATPWLSYGCSIGARLRTPHGYATVVKVRDDDTCQIAYDSISEKNKKPGHDLLKGAHDTYIDPRPDTVSRTSSPSYKAGQVLMLVHERRLVDVVVEQWLGARHGSRHKVRFGSGKKVASQTKKAGDKGLVELDLNEQNHAKLMFSSVAKYETARSNLLDVLQAEHSTVHEDIIKHDLRVSDQRIYLRSTTIASPDAAESGADEAGADDASAPAKKPSTIAPAKGPSQAAERHINALALVSELIAPPSDGVVQGPNSLFVLTRSTAEHELMHSQALFTLSSTLLTDAARLGTKTERRQVPVPLTVARLAELIQLGLQDETKRAPPRDMMLRAIEASYPKRVEPSAPDVLKQAIELHAVVIVADVRTESDLIALETEAVMEELLANRTLIIAPEELAKKAVLPTVVYERCRTLEVDTWGCFLNDARLLNGDTKKLLLQMKSAPGRSPMHYERISVLHLSNAQLNKDTQSELAELLKSCMLRMLDVSNTHVDGAVLTAALKSCPSLRSLDVRMVPGMKEFYEPLGNMLLQPESSSQLAYVRCDDFELLEGEKMLNLREQPLEKGAVRLLIGLFKNNRDVQEVDLAATGLHKEWAASLLETLKDNPTVTSMHLPYNPLLDESGQAALVAAVEQHSLKIALHF